DGPSPASPFDRAAGRRSVLPPRPPAESTHLRAGAPTPFAHRHRQTAWPCGCSSPWKTGNEASSPGPWRRSILLRSWVPLLSTRSTVVRIRPCSALAQRAAGGLVPDGSAARRVARRSPALRKSSSCPTVPEAVVVPLSDHSTSCLQIGHGYAVPGCPTTGTV